MQITVGVEDKKHQIDEERIAVLKEWFFETDQYDLILLKSSLSENNKELIITSKNTACLSSFHDALIQACDRRNFFEGHKNGHAYKAPKIDKNKVIIDKALINSLKITKEYTEKEGLSNDLDMISTSYDLSLRQTTSKEEEARKAEAALKL